MIVRVKMCRKAPPHLSRVTLDTLEILCPNVAMSMKVRKRIGREEFDYAALMSALADYAKPNDKVTQLLRAEVIIRVKKGLYVFGEDYRRRPYSRELLANLVYGPSFVSLDYALAVHGLIPERLAQVTSVTTGRARSFKTPVGTFVYRPTPREAFHLGMLRVEQEDIAFLIADPERALADKIREDRTARVRSLAEARRYLLEDLRIDESRVTTLHPGSLHEYGVRLRSRKVQWCAKWLLREGDKR